MSIAETISRRCFQRVHGRHLVYNQCWEDPRLDREALDLTADDHVVLITSAGCNALDYALCGPAGVHAVDMNPRQNALLELKLAGIRTLEHDDFFALFGDGRHPHWQGVYRDRLRGELPDYARAYWDRHSGMLDGNSRRRSLYFHGSSGLFAYAVNRYIDRIVKLRGAVEELLAAPDTDRQREVCDRHRLDDAFWRPLLRWTVRRDATLALLGVPRPQRRQIDRTYPGGIGDFIVDRVMQVFRDVPIHDNYFWRVYLTGRYAKDCCPEYLRAENFARLKEVAGNVHTHNGTMIDFLQRTPTRFSRFVLLDHMDWLADTMPELLSRQWQAVFDAATPDARAIWRSADLRTHFLDDLPLPDGTPLGRRLTYHRDLAERLHRRDRVNTYGSFAIADLVAA